MDGTDVAQTSALPPLTPPWGSVQTIVTGALTALLTAFVFIIGLTPGLPPHVQFPVLAGSAFLSVCGLLMLALGIVSLARWACRHPKEKGKQQP